MSSLHTPGPGNYNIGRDLGKVSYSFGLKGPSTLVGTRGSPGPGAYSLRTSFMNIPGSKIGTSTRDDDFNRAARVGSPGPGAYRATQTLVHCPIKLDAPVYGFGTQNRDKMHFAGQVLSPGPGAYNHKQIIGRDGPSKTMISRRPESARSFLSNPGPGQYTPKREFSAKRVPKYSIGTSQRDGSLGLKHTRGNPGPDMYSPSKTTLKRMPSWVMGTGQRQSLTETENTPGPGNYQLKPKITEGPKVK